MASLELVDPTPALLHVTRVDREGVCGLITFRTEKVTAEVDSGTGTVVGSVIDGMALVEGHSVEATAGGVAGEVISCHEQYLLICFN